MWFLRPMAFIGLIALPLILALYMFKRKQKEIRVSSVFLWSRAISGNRPHKAFEKIRKSLLLFLQLLAAALCVFAMAAPYIKTNWQGESCTVIIDNSLSMSADNGDNKGISRLDEAKAKAAALIKSSPMGSAFSVSVINSRCTPLIAYGDKNAALKAVEGVEQTYIPVDYGCMPQPKEGESLAVFSDVGLDMEGVSSYSCGKPFDNWGITALAASGDGQSVRVLGKVKNFGSNAAQRQICLYADDKLYETRELTLAPDETKDIVFTGLSADTIRVKAQLAEGDGFAADDSRFSVIASNNEIKALLTGDNPFLERALSVMPKVNIYKNTKGSLDSESLKGYDLYIFSGAVPSTLPADGQIMLFNPESSPVFAVEGEVEISEVISREGKLSLTKPLSFEVYKSKKITLPQWGEEIASSAETPLIFSGAYGKQKILTVGFDLSNSDLPLKMDFPIFLYDALNDFFPQGAVKEGDIAPGEAAELNISPLAERVRVITPSEEAVDIAPPFPAGSFTGGEQGFYYLEQTINGAVAYEPFGVNIGYSEEQYFNYETEDSQRAAAAATRLSHNYDLQWLFLVLTVIVLIGELVLYLYRHKSGFTKLGTVLRALVIALLIASILDPQLKLPTKGVTTVFAVDASHSTEDSLAAEIDFVNEALKNKPGDESVAALIFGKSSEILFSPTADKDRVDIAAISQAVSEGTDIASGLNTAASLLKEKGGKRIVLLTDGSENSGDAFAAASSLKNQGAEIKTAGFLTDIGAEAQLKQLRVPEYLTSPLCRAEIVIESTAAQKVGLQLYGAGKKLYDEQLMVTEGENRFTATVEIEGSGSIDLRAVIEPEKDRYYQNNTAYAHSYISDTPSVLLLEYGGSGSGMAALIESAGLKTTRLDIGAAPKTAEALNGYAAVVMADCPYYEMEEEFVTALESYVKSSAGGLLVTAGENSLALGGYKGTVLENILPVNMEMTDNSRKKDKAIVMVVDRSGSMSSGNYGVSKLELVKEAMARSAGMLEEDDSIGILAFDDGFKWVIEPQRVGDSIDSIESSIYSINDGGGTSIQPAIQEAVNVLSGYEADSKHIILMTDGQGESSGYEPIISKALESGISISTVAAGDDSDQELLKKIAARAEGRYYYTDEFTDLPKIFERETALSNKNYINNEEFYPTVNGSFDVMTGIENMPALGGYVASSQKAAADTVLTHEGMEPILARWQYGLGHTAVFAADIQNQAAAFLSADEGQTILKNTLSSVMRSQSYGAVETSFESKNGKGIVTVQTKDEAVIAITADLVGEDIKEEPIFKQTEPGVFKAETSISRAGNYILNLSLTKENGSDFSGAVISVPYSMEYDIDNMRSGTALLDKLYTVSQKITSPDEVFTKYNQRAYESLSVSLYLIIAALVLFLAELAIRRFKPKFKLRPKKGKRSDKEKKPEKEKPRDKNVPKPKPEKKEAEQQTDMSATSSLLLKNKQKREK